MYWADEAKLEIAKRLKEEFGNDLVRAEWRSSAKNEDWLKIGEVYSPRPDIAVGPFNTSTQDIERTVGEIRQKFDEKKDFFRLFDIRHGNNGNPRCLLAIETEGSRRGKYSLGNLLNSAILGYVGIVIVKEELWGDIKRIESYLDGAFKHGKIKEKVTKNLALFKYEDFKRKLEKGKDSKRF